MSDTFGLACYGTFLVVVLGLIVYGAWKAYTPRGFVLYFAMWALQSSPAYAHGTAHCPHRLRLDYYSQQW